MLDDVVFSERTAHFAAHSLIAPGPWDSPADGDGDGRWGIAREVVRMTGQPARDPSTGNQGDATLRNCRWLTLFVIPSSCRVVAFLLPSLLPISLVEQHEPGSGWRRRRCVVFGMTFPSVALKLEIPYQETICRQSVSRMQ